MRWAYYHLSTAGINAMDSGSAIPSTSRQDFYALPNASFIGFTSTPIEKEDANTRAVFGDYISVYDIQRAVEDGATVPLCFTLGYMVDRYCGLIGSAVGKLSKPELHLPRTLKN